MGGRYAPPPPQQRAGVGLGAAGRGLIKFCSWLMHHKAPQQHALRFTVSYEYKTMPIEHINTN